MNYLIFYRVGCAINIEKGTLQEMQTRYTELQFEDIEATIMTGDKEQEIVEKLQQLGGTLCINPPKNL